jgi:hypothetical protein
MAARPLERHRLPVDPSRHDGDGGQQIDDGPALHKEIIADEGRVIDRVAPGRMEGLVDDPPCAILSRGGPAEI